VILAIVEPTKHLARAIVYCCVALILAVQPAIGQTVDEPGAPRTAAAATLLQINDVYSTAPVDGVGGLARVATVKKKLAATGRAPLLMIAGDFLSSSVASTVFKGEQMVAALNAAGLDVATLGNHEFDFGIDVLLQRMTEAKWQWVVSNVIDRETGKPIGNAAPYLVRTVGTQKIGIIGLCIAGEGLTRDKLARVALLDPIEAAAKYLPELKRERVDIIVALTHLSYGEDRELAERFPEIDVIVGGHEHYPITSIVGRTLISKAGSEARYVARVDVTRRSDHVERFYELIPVTSAIPDDPATAAVVDLFEKRLGTELDKPVGSSVVPLDGVTLHLRMSETNLGNLVADAIRAEANTDVALVNGGGIRGDRVVPPGPLTRRNLIAMHPFNNIVCTLEVTGATLLAILEHGVSRLPIAAGHFPQVSGMAFRIDERAPAGSRVSEVTILGAPLARERVYTLAVPDFLVNGGDGYDMLANQKVLVAPEFGTLIVVALEHYLAAHADISPSIEGRIHSTK
jgi:5'-nucleotidase